MLVLVSHYYRVKFILKIELHSKGLDRFLTFFLLSHLNNGTNKRIDLMLG